jgi:N-succinyl-L-ornithine transcarbamylase
MTNFFSIQNVPNVYSLIYDGLLLKKHPYIYNNIGRHKTIGLIFFNPSLRTRLSIQKAAFYIGCNYWVLDINNQSWQLEFNDGVVMNNTQEHLKEAILVMSLYCDIIAVRTFPKLINRPYEYQEILLKTIQNISIVPIVNLESSTLHPLQSVADMMTIEEIRPKFKKRIKVVLSWAPHPKSLPHSVVNSFIQWIHLMNDVDIFITHPKGYELDKQFNCPIIYNQLDAFKDADFIYVKNWSSYIEYGINIYSDINWMITKKKIYLTNKAKIMHCLPVRRNIVVEDSVLDGNDSIVGLEAENRVFAAQSVLKSLFCKYIK